MNILKKLKTLINAIRQKLSRPKQKWPPDNLYHGGPYDDECG